MMQIVIDIPKEVNEIILNTSFIVDIEIMMKQTAKEREQTNAIFSLIDAIRNGTPLPEHHGRLIDADAFVKYCRDGLSFFLPMFTTKEYRQLAIDVTKSIIKDIKEAPTIIPATKEEKHCKACKYSDNGMINVESERCKACYYDGRLGGNCLFVPKQTATKEGDYDCVACAHDGDSNICLECEDGSKYLKWR